LERDDDAAHKPPLPSPSSQSIGTRKRKFESRLMRIGWMQKIAPRKQAADRKAIDAELPLYSVLPTTPAGAAALSEYVHSDAHWQWQGPAGSFGRDGVPVPPDAELTFPGFALM
jgi:hypothetical protein